MQRVNGEHGIDAAELRRRDLAKIHLARKQLGLDEATYRGMLLEIAGVESAASLNEAGRRTMLEHLRARGFKQKRGRPHPGSPRNLESEHRGPMLRKIEALLAEKGRLEGCYVAWEYARTILKKMHGVEKLEWASTEHLRGLIGALDKDIQRRTKRTMRG